MLSADAQAAKNLQKLSSYEDPENLRLLRARFQNPNLCTAIGEKIHAAQSSHVYDTRDIPELNKLPDFQSESVSSGAQHEIDEINNILYDQFFGDTSNILQNFRQALEITSFAEIKRIAEENEEGPAAEGGGLADCFKMSILHTFHAAFHNWMITTYQPKMMKNKLQDLAQLMRDSGKLETIFKSHADREFVDGEFPAKSASITGFGENCEARLLKVKNFSWRRAHQIYRSGYTVFNKIHFEDIIQGELRDCYFLAALSSLCLRPHRVQKLFLNPSANPQGVYSIALCINGIWEEVIIDDLFPVDPKGEPAFTKSRKNELWVLLLEKAWAKIHGGYGNISVGLTREALRDLTGASAKTFFTKKEKNNGFRILQQSTKNEFIMTAGSDNLNNGKDAQIEKIGLAGSHAYSIIGAYFIGEDADGHRILDAGDERLYARRNKLIRMVKLRNPWGKGEWNGDWSDNCPKWSPQLKRLLDLQEKNDGIFFMDYSDFCKFFSDFQVCYYHENYRYSSLKLATMRNETIVLKISLAQKGEYYFSVNQKNKRFFPSALNYAYSPLTFVLGAVDERNQPLFIGSSITTDKENWIQTVAAPGTYYALIKTPWKHNVNEFSFSVYGPDTVDICKMENKQKSLRVFKQILLAHAEAEKAEHKRQESTGLEYFLLDTKGGIGYIYLNNRSSETLSVTLEMVRSRNIDFSEPYSGKRPMISLAADKKDILIYEASVENYSTSIRVISTVLPNPIYIKNELADKGIKIYVGDGASDSAGEITVCKKTDGVLLSFLNKSVERYWKEKLTFQLMNCFFKNSPGNYIELTVKPLSEEFLEVVREAAGRTFFIKLVSRKYEFIL